MAILNDGGGETGLAIPAQRGREPDVDQGLFNGRNIPGQRRSRLGDSNP